MYFLEGYLYNHMNRFTVVFSFVAGAFALCLCSTFQKLVIGAPLVLIGYVVPFFFGGFAGAGLGLWYTRFQKTNEELVRARDELEDAVAARTDDLQNALARKQESEQALWAIVDTMHSGIVLLDAAGKISFANQRMAEMFGCRLEQLLGSDYHAHIQDAELPKAREKLSTLILGETEVVSHERCYCRLDGSSFWGAFAGRRILRQDGVFWMVVGVIADITSAKHLEQEREHLIAELQEALARVRTLSGLLPICSICKKIRDDQGYWNHVEAFVEKHSDAEFSHSICEECARKYYPDLDLYEEEEEGNW